MAIRDPEWDWHCSGRFYAGLQKMSQPLNIGRTLFVGHKTGPCKLNNILQMVV